MKWFLSQVLFLMLPVTVAPVLAASVAEVESSGTELNNTPAQAQLLLPADFTAPEPAEVFPRLLSSTVTVYGTGGSNVSQADPEAGPDIDFFEFTTQGTGPNVAIIDLDNGVFGFDGVLALFDSAGTLIAIGDDTSPQDAGSASTLDPLIGAVALVPGTYYAALTVFANFPTASNGTTTTPLSLGGEWVLDAAVGNSSFQTSGADAGVAYRLNISLQTPVLDGDVAPLGSPDGQINIADYLVMTRMAMGMLTPGSLELVHGDLYPVGLPDGVIDLRDLQQMHAIIFP